MFIDETYLLQSDIDFLLFIDPTPPSPDTHWSAQWSRSDRHADVSGEVRNNKHTEEDYINIDDRWQLLVIN